MSTHSLNDTCSYECAHTHTQTKRDREVMKNT